MIDWDAIYTAIQSVVATATGITVIRANQNAPQPAYPYVTYKRLTPGARETEFGEVRYSEDLGAGPGEEIIATAASQVAFTMSFQAFADSDAPAANADHYLTLLQGALALPSVQRTLRAAHAVPVEIVDSQNLDDIAGGEWKSRASLDIRFRTVLSSSEATGYIATTEVAGTYVKPDTSTVQRTGTLGNAP